MKLLATILILVGLGLFGTSLYIQGRVEEGKDQVGRAESQVNQSEQVIKPIRPFARRVERQATGSARERIAAAKEDITYYEGMAKNFRIGGIASFALGVLLFLFRRKKK